MAFILSSAGMEIFSDCVVKFYIVLFFVRIKYLFYPVFELDF